MNKLGRDFVTLHKQLYSTVPTADQRKHWNSLSEGKQVALIALAKARLVQDILFNIDQPKRTIEGYNSLMQYMTPSAALAELIADAQCDDIHMLAVFCGLPYDYFEEI